MSDFVKRLQDERDGAEFSNRYADLVGEAADRIERLERDLAQRVEQVGRISEGWEIADKQLKTALKELAAEKALADRLAECVRKLWAGPAYIEMVEDVEEAYRKARGL